jgi:hypothetical protein
MLLAGNATTTGAVGGVSVMVPSPVAMTFAGDASRLSSFTSWTIVAETESSTWVSKPNAGSNSGRLTLPFQLVVASGMKSHDTKALNGVAVGEAVEVGVPLCVAVCVGVRVGVRVAVPVMVAVRVGV